MEQSQEKVFAALVFVFILLCLSCSSLRAGRSDSVPPKPVFTSTGNPTQELRDALVRLKSSYPYRVTGERTESGSSPARSSKFTLEYAAADRTYFKSENFEGIEIGEKNYGNYNGKWKDMGSVARGPQLENILIEHMTDVRTAGFEIVKDIPCAIYTARYEFTWKEHPGAGTSRIWISTTDGLPRQLDDEFKQGDLVSNSRRFYEYDPAIKVEEPVLTERPKHKSP